MRDEDVNSIASRVPFLSSRTAATFLAFDAAEGVAQRDDELAVALALVLLEGGGGVSGLLDGWGPARRPLL